MTVFPHGLCYRLSAKSEGLADEARCRLLRVSTLDQTTANQERELRQIAGRVARAPSRRLRPASVSSTPGATLNYPQEMLRRVELHICS